MAEAVKRRSYDSSRRRAQAKETRSADRAGRSRPVRRAGLRPHHRADIAGAAGVSVETIYAAFGNKATLLHEAWDITVGGDDQDIVFHERPEVMAIRNEPDLAQRLMLHAAFSTQTAQRIAPVPVDGAVGRRVPIPRRQPCSSEMGRQRLVGMT